jgi:hypothetical protein
MLSLDRRSMLQRALLLVGAAATPGFSAAALAQDKAPLLLNATQFELLTAVADTIVPVTDTPGAVAAGVPRTFDALLRNWASDEQKRHLTGALETIDKLAREKEGKPFAKLTPAARYALLSAHDAEAMKAPAARPQAAGNPEAKSPSVVDPNYGRPQQTPPASAATDGTPRLPNSGSVFSRGGQPVVSDPGYAKLKELIVILFYISETALTNELTYEHAPGSWDPSIPITPQTRPYGGAGAI